MRTQLQLGRLQVRIHWGIALCVTLTFALLVNLGFWQLGRAAEKRALQREMLARQELPALALAQVQPRIGSLSEDQAVLVENLRVSVSGRYWNEGSFLVAFQFFQGAPGFELVTPFLVEGTEETLLVSRGWIAPGPGDDGMPYIVPVAGDQTLTGQLHVPAAVAGTTQVEGEAWPLRLRRMDLTRAAEVLDLARGLTAQGVTVLLVEQNVKQGLRVADHCYILAEGRNQIDGPADRLAADPVVGEIYLGGRRMGAA